MNKSKKFSPEEVRERAVRLVQEHRGEYRSLWAAVQSIAPKVGCGPRTLLRWVKGGEMDAGVSQFTGSCHYFAVHGLSPRPPELLNKYLQVAISQLHRAEAREHVRAYGHL